MLTKERQAWCNLQVTLCDPCLRALRVCLHTKITLYKYSSFPFSTFQALLSHAHDADLKPIIYHSTNWSTNQSLQTFVANESKMRLLCRGKHFVDGVKPFIQVVETRRICDVVDQQNSLQKHSET